MVVRHLREVSKRLARQISLARGWECAIIEARVGLVAVQRAMRGHLLATIRYISKLQDYLLDSFHECFHFIQLAPHVSVTRVVISALLFSTGTIYWEKVIRIHIIHFHRLQ